MAEKCTEGHKKGSRYICDAVREIVQPYSNVKACSANIKRSQTGSGNWPIQIAVGAAINQDASGQDLGPFLRGENGWGLNGTEHGSSIYEGWNFASIVALINKAPGYTRPGPRRQDALRWIKAEIAKYCLSMATRRPRRSILFVEGEMDHSPGPLRDGLERHARDGWSYRTDKEYDCPLYAVMPGSRQIERFNRHPNEQRQQEHTVFVDRNQVTPMIAWALGIRPRKFSTGNTRSPTGAGWCVWLAQEATGVAFEDNPEPSKFGLTAQDVKTFKRFLRDREDPAPILTYLDGYGAARQQKCHWIQLENGDLVAWNNKTIHSSTTGCTLAWTEGERVFWASPQSTSRTSGTATCKRQGDALIVSAKGKKLKSPPVKRRFELLANKDVRWEVAWTRGGFELEIPGGDDDDDDDDDDRDDDDGGNGDGGGGGALPAKARRAIERAENIPGFADDVPPRQGASATALQRIKNRAGRIARLLRQGTAAGRDKAIRLAQTIGGLAEVPQPRLPDARTAIQRIKNHAREILRLLTT